MGNDERYRNMIVKPIQPIITTKRLKLRPLLSTDKEAVYSYAKLPNVGPMAGWEPHDTLKNTEDFLLYSHRKREYGQPGVYAIELKDSHQMIGTIEIHSYKEQKGAIGFVVHPDFWNKGYVTEASKAMIIYAMEILELKRLEYCHFPHNHASKRVCEKLGFTFEGVLRNKYLLYDGTVLDDVVYSITIEDYTEENLKWIISTKQDIFIDL